MRLAHSFEGRIGADYSPIGITSNIDRFFICVLLRLNFFPCTKLPWRDSDKIPMKQYQSVGKIACFVTALFLILNWFGGMSVVAGASLSEDKPVRVTTNFDGDWRFLKADAAGAEKTEFDDATWRKLDVPHDWSIEGPFEFDVW